MGTFTIQEQRMQHAIQKMARPDMIVTTVESLWSKLSNYRSAILLFVVVALVSLTTYLALAKTSHCDSSSVLPD